jgi:hypothetical protein
MAWCARALRSKGAFAIQHVESGRAWEAMGKNKREIRKDLACGAVGDRQVKQRFQSAANRMQESWKKMGSAKH